jgi:prepilin-type N-terminal cleavage/methylation domain-containing protein
MIFQYPRDGQNSGFRIQNSEWKRNSRTAPGSTRRATEDWGSVVGRGADPADRGGAGRGFTLIEVLASMAVLVVLMLALTRMFVSSANITSRGLTTIARNSVGETAMDSILQDLDCMVVNERIACAKRAGKVLGGGEEDFDTFYFIGTAGDQDDDLPYEYFKYYVKPQTMTNALGAVYRRFDLMKARVIMAVGAGAKSGGSFYALRPADTEWWDLFDAETMDDEVVAENVVLFDIYCQRWDTGNDFVTDGNDFYSVDVLAGMSNIPPVAVDVMLVLTSPEAAVEGGMLIASGDTQGGWKVLHRDSSTLIGRAMPMMGPTQYRLQRRTYNPVSHYSK